MDRKECGRLVKLLPRRRRRFFYHRDRYALLLLEKVLGERRAIRELRASPYARLLERPLIKDLIAQSGDGALRAEQLVCAWPVLPEVYRLSLGWWGDDGTQYQWWDQTSRGGWSFVIRLNFSADHDRLYNRLAYDGRRHWYEFEHHPIEKRGDWHTMAWARVDLNLDQGEALIEEIQNDWIRRATTDRQKFEGWTRETLSQKDASARRKVLWVGQYRGIDQYVRGVLAPHTMLWAEATLSAAIEMLVHELGIRRIFYHTWESGTRLKQINGRKKPPRSLYSDLPRKFCFAETDEVPQFLQWEERPAGWRGKKKLTKKVRRELPGGTRFFVLNL